MRPRVAVVAAALAVAAMTVPAGATARASASSCLGSLPQVQQVTTDGTRPLADSTPVLFVHGINSGPGVWRPTSPSSISGQAAAIPGVTAWTFSYAHQSLLWVDKQPIGPDLAHAISCLATVSGHKVVVVGHSMGGLATQYALGQDQGQVAGRAAELVTIGTPFDGSEILTIGEDVINGGLTEIDNPNVALVEALLSACAGVADHSDSNPCGLVSALRSPVGTALEAHSAAIRSLPAWPAGFPVYDTAGDMKVSMLGHDFDFGDGAGTLASAIAHNTSGSPEIVRCHKSFWDLTHVDDGLCFHTSLPHNPTIVAAVLAAIRANLLPAQPWTSGELTITPHSLGTVNIGMTIPQASAAAGEPLVQVGDGVLYPEGDAASGLSVSEGGPGGTVSCVSAHNYLGVGAHVVTQQGFSLGGTLARLKAAYGSALRFVPAPTGGIAPYPGYVVSFPDGNLAFLVRDGTVEQIIGGPGVLPSTECA